MKIRELKILKLVPSDYVMYDITNSKIEFVLHFVCATDNCLRLKIRYTCFLNIYEVSFYKDFGSFQLRRHRDSLDGPAFFSFRDGLCNELGYYKDGRLHRPDGPAHMFSYDGSYKEVYYLDGLIVEQQDLLDL